MVVGHDFGSSVAAWCALIRPDVFRSVALMSAPFDGPPALPFDTERDPPKAARRPDHPRRAGGAAPAAQALPVVLLDPAGERRMWHCPQGVHDFLRAYFHHKSADWKGNRPLPLAALTAEELAKMPTYYIMDLADDMPTTVAPGDAVAAEIAACRWLPDEELAVYSRRVSSAPAFRAACNGTASRSGGAFEAELQLFSGRTIDVPSMLHRGQERLGRLPAAGRL